eukprot:471570_1
MDQTFNNNTYPERLKHLTNAKANNKKKLNRRSKIKTNFNKRKFKVNLGNNRNNLREFKIDTNIFTTTDAECNGYNDCSCIKRLMATLSYYQKVSKQPQKFIDFCDKYYSKQYLQDYIH